MNGFETVAWTQIWQVTALAAIVFVAVKTFANNRPHLAHVLWALVLIKCITPPIFSSHISLFSWLAAEVNTAHEERSIPLEFAVETHSHRETYNGISVNVPGFNLLRSGGEKSIDSKSSSPSIATSPKATAVNWQRVFVFVWLFGVVICLLWQACRLMSLRLLVRRKQQHVPVQMETLVAELSSRLGLKRSVKPLMTSVSIGPAVFGLLRPRILLPSAIVKSRPINELEPLIAHELIHIRRGDLWWALLQTVAGALFWFHPLVRLAVVGISRESERSCDEETVASLGCQPADYARCLLNVLEQKHRLRSAPALPGVKPIEITSARLERVMKLGHGSYKKTPWWTWVVLLICGALVLPGAALVFAQESDGGPNASEAESRAVQAKIDDKTLVGLLYPIDDIVEELKKRNPKAEIQELELRLLQYFKGYLLNSDDPNSVQRVTKIHDGKLSAMRTTAGHDKLSDRLAKIRRYGLRQIVIETRVISCLAGTFDDLKWEESADDSFVSKQGVLHRKKAINEKVVQASFEAEDPLLNAEVVTAATLISESDSKRDGKHELRDTKEAKHPLFNTILNEEELKALLLAGNVTNNSFAVKPPTLVMFDGQSASIDDLSRMPFVTGVDAIKGCKGEIAYQPLISILGEGTALEISAESASDTEIKIQAEVTLSELVDVQTFTFPGATADSGVSIQLPALAANQLRFESIVDKNNTLVVRIPNPADRKLELLFVISPVLVEGSEFVKSTDWKRSTQRKLATVAGQTDSTLDGVVADRGQTLPSAYYLEDDLQFHRSVAWKHSIAERFEEICFANKADASDEEIDQCIKDHAAVLGVYPQLWMELVAAERELSETQIRKIISNEVRFGKLSNQVQRTMRENRLGVCVDANIAGIVIRSQDDQQNWDVDKAKIIEVSDERVVVRTDVKISATQDGIEFVGENLEVVTTKGEPFASADEMRLVMSDNDASVQLTGNSRLVHYGEATISADTIQYDSRSETLMLLIEGNARLVCEEVSFSADRIEQVDEKMVLTGNAKLKHTTDESREFKGQKIEVGDNGNIVVDGQDMGELDF